MIGGFNAERIPSICAVEWSAMTSSTLLVLQFVNRYASPFGRVSLLRSFLGTAVAHRLMRRPCFREGHFVR